MRIAFHSNQLGSRGTEVSLWKYAKYNEELLGNTSFIISRRGHRSTSLEVVEKFRGRFPVYLYDSQSELESIVAKERIEIFYCQKSGENDGVICRRARTCVHAVFMHKELHGDKYAYISEWLSQQMSKGSLPFVPYIVELPRISHDFREVLGIPNSARVFGRHGGKDTFDIPFVQKAVIAVAKRRPDTYFLFMNNSLPRRSLLGTLPKNIIFLPPTSTSSVKAAFINTCDAMIHARLQGETFGLAVAEFSFLNKPVITYRDSCERAHLHMLGDRSILYSDYDQVVEILLNFRPDASKDWDCFSKIYSAERVMNQFASVFLE